MCVCACAPKNLDKLFYIVTLHGPAAILFHQKVLREGCRFLDRQICFVTLAQDCVTAFQLVIAKCT